MKTSRFPWLAVALLLVVTPLIASAHRHTDAWAPRADLGERVRYLPSGEALSAASLGYRGLVADVLWARATLLFGEHYMKDDEWHTWLFHLIDLVTDLDPKFRAAYKYGGTMLRVDGEFIDQSNLVFQKGMHALPNEWYLPFGIAMNYFTYRENKALAADYMRRAVAAGTGPFYLRNLAASLESEGRELESALTFLEEEAKNLPAGDARDAVDVKIFETKYLIAKRDAEAAVGAFRSRFGRDPKQPGEVPAAGMPWPADPLGGTWEWDRAEDAEWGSLRSSRYYDVFRGISKAKGLGALGIDDAHTPLGPTVPPSP